MERRSDAKNREMFELTVKLDDAVRGKRGVEGNIGELNNKIAELEG